MGILMADIATRPASQNFAGYSTEPGFFETLKEAWDKTHASTRLIGVAQMIGGGAETLGGAGTAALGAASGWTGAGVGLAVGGGALMLDGANNVGAGWDAATTGKSHDTVREKVVHDAVVAAGGNETTATVVNVATDFAMPVGSFPKFLQVADKVGKLGETEGKLAVTTEKLAETQEKAGQITSDLLTTSNELAQSRNQNIDLLHENGELQDKAAHFKRLAHTDTLTGLANRAAYQEKNLEMLEKAEKGEGEFHTLLIDFDDFKTYNAEANGGLKNGDQALKNVSAALADALPKDGTVQLFRTGGDEFTAIVESPNHQVAMGIAEKARAAVAQLTHTPRGVPDAQPMHPTLSVGVAKYKQGDHAHYSTKAGEGADTMHERANSAVNVSKEKGKNAVSSEREIPTERRAEP